MKVGIVSPYLSTMGGGERYILTAAEYFTSRKDSVEIFSPDKIDSKEIKDRFSLDLSKAKINGDWRRWLSTFGYDLMFFVSDGSIPLTFAAQNILHFQVPFNNKDQITLSNKLKLSRFSKVICNSWYTKKFVDQTYGVNSDVIYPPVDVERFNPGKKENMILSVGRFFAPLQAKKQEIMVEVFKRMKIPGWRLVLIGGVEKESTSRVRELLRLAGGSLVEIITDVHFETLQDYYARAKIYWHAAGFGENLEQYPERAEHFGMSTVEAMAAGCVPIVFAGGGQLEIVAEGQTGYFWKNTRELVTKTRLIIKNDRMRKSLSELAINKSKHFSKGIFYQNMDKLLG